MTSERTAIRAALPTAALLASFLPLGCAPPVVIPAVRGGTMGAYYEVKWAPPPDRPLLPVDVQAAVEALLGEINAAFSTWDERSVISRFNAHASTEPFAIDAAHRERFLAVTRLALRVAELTGGAFDPTIQPLVELRGFGKAQSDEPPSAEAIAAARARVDWRRLTIDADGRLVKARPDLALTFSALVPGWAADQIAAKLAAMGARGCMVDVGGEIACQGQRPDGAPWTIGIARPTPPGVEEQQHTRVSFSGGLATSGSYRTFREEDDQIVHHILDPRTGENARHPWVSVSVLADSAGLADALATALMVVGADGAEPIVAAFAAQRVRALFLGVPRSGGQVPERRFGW